MANAKLARAMQRSSAGAVTEPAQTLDSVAARVLAGANIYADGPAPSINPIAPACGPRCRPSLAATRPFIRLRIQTDTDKADAGLASSLLGNRMASGSTRWERGASALLTFPSGASSLTPGQRPLPRRQSLWCGCARAPGRAGGRRLPNAAPGSVRGRSVGQLHRCSCAR